MKPLLGTINENQRLPLKLGKFDDLAGVRTYPDGKVEVAYIAKIAARPDDVGTLDGRPIRVTSAAPDEHRNPFMTAFVEYTDQATEEAPEVDE